VDSTASAGTPYTVAGETDSRIAAYIAMLEDQVNSRFTSSNPSVGLPRFNPALPPLTPTTAAEHHVEYDGVFNLYWLWRATGQENYRLAAWDLAPYLAQLPYYAPGNRNYGETPSQLSSFYSYMRGIGCLAVDGPAQYRAQWRTVIQDYAYVRGKTLRDGGDFFDPREGANELECLLVSYIMGDRTISGSAGDMDVAQACRKKVDYLLTLSTHKQESDGSWINPGENPVQRLPYMIGMTTSTMACTRGCSRPTTRGYRRR
jgi:hypothetical protein